METLEKTKEKMISAVFIGLLLTIINVGVIYYLAQKWQFFKIESLRSVISYFTITLLILIQSWITGLTINLPIAIWYCHLKYANIPLEFRDTGSLDISHYLIKHIRNWRYVLFTVLPPILAALGFYLKGDRGAFDGLMFASLAIVITYLE